MRLHFSVNPHPHTGDVRVLYYGTNIFSSLHECDSCHGRVYGLESGRRRTGRTTGKWSDRLIHIFSYTYSHMHTTTHTHTNTHTHTHIQTHTHTHTHTHSLSLSRTHTHSPHHHHHYHYHHTGSRGMVKKGRSIRIPATGRDHETIRQSSIPHTA